MKKIYLGLFSAIIALVAMAFTSRQRESLGSFYLVQQEVNKFTTINFRPWSVTCEGSAELNCYYKYPGGQIVYEPANGVYYTEKEIVILLDNGIINEGGYSLPGLYVPF